MDFSCATRYLDNLDRHIKNNLVLKSDFSDPHRYLFASKNFFSGQTLSRRDDIIQIVHNLVYLLNPKNQEVEYIMEQDDVFSGMGDYKLSASPEDVCSEDICKCLIPLLAEAYSYDFEEKPQYGKLKFMLEHELLKINCIPDLAFTWM